MKRWRAARERAKERKEVVEEEVRDMGGAGWREAIARTIIARSQGVASEARETDFAYIAGCRFAPARTIIDPLLTSLLAPLLLFASPPSAFTLSS